MSDRLRLFAALCSAEESTVLFSVTGLSAKQSEFVSNELLRGLFPGQPLSHLAHDMPALSAPPTAGAVLVVPLTALILRVGFPGALGHVSALRALRWRLVLNVIPLCHRTEFLARLRLMTSIEATASVRADGLVGLRLLAQRRPGRLVVLQLLLRSGADGARLDVLDDSSMGGDEPDVEARKAATAAAMAEVATLIIADDEEETGIGVDDG